jgi:hypothetical protein
MEMGLNRHTINAGSMMMPMEKRRPLMDAWGQFCGRPPAEVVTLAGQFTRKRAG